MKANPSQEQISTAYESGHGDDILHAALCGWLGIPESCALREAAGIPCDSFLAILEEEAVLAVQKFRQFVRNK